MNYECSNDSVTISEANETGEQIYIIDPDETAPGHTHSIAASVTHLYTGTTCTMSVQYYYWDTNNQDWRLVSTSGWNSNPFTVMDAVGAITVATLDDGAITPLRPYTKVTLRVAYTADLVKNWFSERTVYDEFDVIFKEDCSDNVLTLSSNLNDIEYYIGQTVDTSTVSFQI